MPIIPNQKGRDNAVSQCCQDFIKRFRLNTLLREVNATKEKGICAYEIFAFVLGLVFSSKNLYALYNTCPEKISFGKDAIYRFLSKGSTNWNSFIMKLAFAVIEQIDILTSTQRRTALIFDDSPYYRNRSKKVEMLSLCYDHVEKLYYKGLTLLAMGWSDGQTFVPVNAHLVAAGQDKNLLNGANVKTDNRTLATKRRIDARKEKPALVIEMLKAIKGTVAQAKYVLFDSWFSSPYLILAVNNLGYQVVTRLKNTDKHRYFYHGESHSISSIYALSKKRRGKSRYLLSVIIEVHHKNSLVPIEAKLVYVRSKSNRKKWIALLSTDLSLSEEDIIALYGKRWDIEVFFKVIKSYLRLTKEFQMRSFDAMSAHMAIVLTRYILLSLENRENKDERTIGELFYVSCKELEDISFAFAFEVLVNFLKQNLTDYIHLPKSQVIAFVEQFIGHLPLWIKDKLPLSMCES